MIRQPIFLIGAHKSGTTLLRSIFDGHRELFAVPFETHFFQAMHYWVDYEYRTERPKKITKQELISRLTNYLQRLNNANDALGDSPAGFQIDINRFKDKIRQIPDISDDPTTFTLYIEAVHYALLGNELSSDKRVVEKSVEHAEFASSLYKMFPDARFVHILRNPYATMVSLRKYKAALSVSPLVARMLRTLYNSYYYLYRNPKLIPSYYILKYEDLLADPEHEIRKLAGFLKIDFSEILLTPTKLNRSWQGNSSDGESRYDFDQSRIDAWKSDISPMEIRYVNALFPFIFNDYGYSQLPSPGMLSFLKPLKGEGMLRYIVNRWYLAYLSYNPGSEF